MGVEKLNLLGEIASDLHQLILEIVGVTSNGIEAAKSEIDGLQEVVERVAALADRTDHSSDEAGWQAQENAAKRADVALAVLQKTTGPELTATAIQVLRDFLEAKTVSDSEEMAWGIIANAYGGNWDLAGEEWRTAAEKWRDDYHSRLSKAQPGDEVHDEPPTKTPA